MGKEQHFWAKAKLCNHTLLDLPYFQCFGEAEKRKKKGMKQKKCPICKKWLWEDEM